MPTFEHLPAWLRTLGRVLRVSSYMLLAVAGLGDLLWDRTGPVESVRYVLGVALVAIGAVTACAVGLHRWRWEWVGVFWLSVVVGLRAIVAWFLPGPPPPLTSAPLVSFAAVMLLLRGLDLTVFALRTSAWAVRLHAPDLAGTWVERLIRRG